MELKVMTFNLRVDVKEDGINGWPNRVDKVAQVISQSKPTVVGTQEALPHMLTALDSQLSEYHWFGKCRQDDDEANAVFYDASQVNLLKEETFWLSETPDVPGSNDWGSLPRICTWALFASRVDETQRFLMFNTHLDHISEQARTRGMHLVWKKIKAITSEYPFPYILTGDFNAEPSSETIAFARGERVIEGDYAVLRDSYSFLENPIEGEIGCTFHGFKGESQGQPIDYIFTSPDIDIKYSRILRGQQNERFPSDHYPVEAVVHIG
ncbi:endonuclease/exonuclease/phosphatase family metal-dependent hydrolase [Pullulanibacillus pueri]|uniref:Endonuclease n=1 Tax=Pullulanibacillus pueri TaxID=1437324 RepID=A0A8J2ZVP1_9BACL|nr:endonuclease/exonuclease/phosphatase family protein [Pullulanibacillus pueri]MBM7682053.1 endonuclease/exonuclease/phosphatase family metal-dependent hydrolase [Pullulanibacillus pueri]GGH80157.1 endonuclease [Pullulanibacillus pueri]